MRNFNLCVARNENDLSIFHLDICSLLNKWYEFNSLISMLNVSFDFICITESWMRKDDPLDIVTMPVQAALTVSSFKV